MDSLETNKAFAAVLVAGMAFVGAGLIANVVVRPKPLHESVLKIDLQETAGSAPGAGGPAGAPEVPISTMMATADAAKGESLVKQQGCVACHSFNEGGKHGVGPNLWGVLGAPHGHEADFSYSAALKAKAGPWTYDELGEWLKKPSAYAPGTKMSYAGLADEGKRADIVAYLRSLSKSPEPLPPAGAVATPASAAATAPAAVKPPANSAPANSTAPAGISAPAAGIPVQAPTPGSEVGSGGTGHPAEHTN